VGEAVFNGVPGVAAQQKRRRVERFAPLDLSAVDHLVAGIGQGRNDLVAAVHGPEVVGHERHLSVLVDHLGNALGGFLELALVKVPCDRFQIG
jgi:hypothetical protein